jgi:hypothetical protein
LKAQIAADSDTARRMLAEYRGPALREHPASPPDDWHEAPRQKI